MRTLIKPDDWVVNKVTEQEAEAFNAALGPCCDTTTFRVHLGGTTCDAWNTSAIRVFVNGFLSTHPRYSPQDVSVREMIKARSRATLDTMIRNHQKSAVPHTGGEVEELRLQRASQE